MSEHVEDELDLPMGELNEVLVLEDEEILADPALVVLIEEVVSGWEKHIIKLIENFLGKVISLDNLDVGMPKDLNARSVSKIRINIVNCFKLIV